MQTGSAVMKLQYQPDAPQRSRGEGRPGHYIGSGVGTVEGALINGEVYWDLYEDQADNRCDGAFVGRVVDGDGNEVEFETRGYLHVPDPLGAPHIWETVMEVWLSSTDGKYSALHGARGTWGGHFDASTYRHEYEIKVGR